MNFIFSFLFGVFIILRGVLSVSSRTLCEKDIERFCRLDSSPITLQSTFDIRVCLRENRDIITQQCLFSLALDKPSIFESCFPEIKAYCPNVGVLDELPLHNCLSGVLEGELSLDCQETLENDCEVTKNPPGRSFSWTKFLMEMSKPHSSDKKGSSLRGVTFIEIRDGKGNIFLSDDENQVYFSDTEIDDDDSDGEEVLSNS